MYCNDNADFIPRESYGTSATLNNWAQISDTSLANSSADVWYNALPVSIGLKPASDFYKNFPARIPDFYSRDSLFHCPSAQFPKDFATSLNAYFSISMNSKLIDGDAKTIRITSIQKPVNTVFFLENRLSPAEFKVDASQSDTGITASAISLLWMVTPPDLKATWSSKRNPARTKARPFFLKRKSSGRLIQP
ncbi:MAG: hypothetical protein WDM76_18570 [Limisphaerales bacterium]